MFGYHDRLLRVDLSSGAIVVEPLGSEAVGRYVGGSGLATHYLYAMLDPQLPALAPESPLIMMAGPLTGTRAPMCGRHAVVARSPLTGWLGESHVGGYVGAALRHAGYDGLIMTGTAERPVWLSLEPGRAELHDAQELWGLETFETQARIRALLGDRRARVACIGPAGENGVLYAGIAHDRARMAARTGLGAVMGAKGLKAVAVCGTGRRMPALADPGRLATISGELRALLKEDVFSQVLRATGTAGNLDYLHYLGALPARYFTLGEWPQATQIGGAAMAETILSGVEACYGCPVACGRRVTLSRYPSAEGGGADQSIKGPEYETLGALGSQLLIDDLEAVAHLAHRCDALGMDSISAGNTLALAVHLYQEGVIGPAETEGCVLGWGDAAMAAALLEQIASRRGLGALLAEGVQRLAERFGVPERAVHVNGMSPAMHDPRAFSGMALVYATSPVGASHNHSAYYLVESGRPLEDLDILSPGRHTDASKAGHVARDQNWNSLLNSLVTCVFCNATPQSLIALCNAATGRDMDAEEALEVGERIFSLKRALNLRWGYTPQGERLPRLLRQSLSEGGTEGFVPDEELLLREYYSARDWDRATGKPSRARLEALGLGDVAQEIGAL
ncbi:MAG: aldehyde ferredoxin oxidoreductase family protein [Anaerolineae bacterium]|nr:aldehyde ferredoxin oxidoreductase family protein [Anaerolineae bacterium]